MYKALTTFADLEDGEHIYHEGDEFPRTGVKVSKERIDYLSGSKNLLGKPVIEKVTKRSK